MANEFAGREVDIQIDGEVVAVCLTKTLTINNSTIDVTTDGDGGIQRLLDIPGVKSVEISVDGKADNTILGETNPLLDKALGTSISSTLTLDYGTYTLSGTFMQTSYSETMATADATTFSATYSSSGAITKTPTP